MARTGQITEHFAWNETAVSGSHPELIEEVPDELVYNAVQLAETVLEPIRTAIGRPMKILSWYRSEDLNTAVGGSETSQHRTASAADFVCTDLREPYELLLTGALVIPCGQVIIYRAATTGLPRFCHIALPSTKYPEPSFFVSATGKSYLRIHSIAQLDTFFKVG